MAIEARYVGTYGRDQWSTLDYNAIRGENLLPNGFMDEFRNAMANLAANNASGVSSRRGSFAYFGSGSGTVPLPIYLAYFNGSRNASTPSAYAGSNWSNSDFSRRLVAQQRDVPPCSLGNACPSYPSRAPALYVLELNAGEATRLQLREGIELRFGPGLPGED